MTHYGREETGISSKPIIKSQLLFDIELDPSHDLTVLGEGLLLVKTRGWRERPRRRAAPKDDSAVPAY